MEAAMNDLLDLGNYPQIHADAIGDVHFLRFHTRILFFEWQKLDGVFRKVISGTVTRPKQAFTEAMLIGLRSWPMMPDGRPAVQGAMH